MQKTFLLLLCCFFRITAQNPLDNHYKGTPDGKTELRFADSSSVVFSKARGHLHGMYYEFYPDGKIAFKARLDNGKYQDSAWTYYKNGAFKSLDVFHSDTIVYSRWDGYYENGKMENSEQVFLHGLGVDIGKTKHGKLKKDNFLVYDAIANNRREFKKIAGARYVHFSYFKNGNTANKEEFLNNKRDGVQLGYYKDGKICSNENYVKGRREGKQYYFDTNGVTSEQCYQRGIKYACDPN